MSDVEIKGRMLALEVLAITSLALYLANSRNDPDDSKAAALLDMIKQTVAGEAASLPPAGQAAASKYAGQLVDTVAKNLRLMRGEGSNTH